MKDIFEKAKALAATSKPAVFTDEQLHLLAENMLNIKRKWDERDREAWRIARDFYLTD